MNTLRFIRDLMQVSVREDLEQIKMEITIEKKRFDSTKPDRPLLYVNGSPMPKSTEGFLAAGRILSSMLEEFEKFDGRFNREDQDHV